jgi:hypothetical protein
MAGLAAARRGDASLTRVFPPGVSQIIELLKEQL